MKATASTDETLRAENAALRARLVEAEDLLRAIRAGEVDALVVETSAGPQLFTLQGVDAEQNRIRGEMLAQVSDAVVAVDTEDHVTFFNAAAERQYGVRSDDILGHKLAEVFTRHWPSPEAEAVMRTALSQRGEWRGELIHRTPDGREFSTEASLTQLRGPDGECTGHLAAIRDITQRKEAEAALRRNTVLFSKIIEQAPGGVYAVDAQFRVTHMNLESLLFFESAESLIGRDFNEVLEIVWGPEVGLRCASIFRHTLATGERYVSPRFCERRYDTGVEQAFEFETQRITLPDGQHGVVCYFQDVTARAKAEALLRLLNDRFDVAVKCSRAVLWQQDLELRFTWLHNPPPGIDGSDAIGKRVEDLLERAEDAAVIVDLKRKVIRSGVGLREEFFVQIRGVDHYFELLLEPLRDAAGLITGITGAAIDITQRKQAEERLRHNERRFRGIFDSAFQYIGLMTPDGTLIEANRTALEGGGLRAENVIGKRFWECNWWTLTERTGRELRNAIGRAASGELVRYNVDVRGAQGQVVTIDFSIKPIRDEAGRVVLLVPEGRDITELKRVEENLRITNQRFDLAVKCSQVVLWQQDLDLRFTWLHNPAPGIDGSNPVGKRDEDLWERAEDAAVIVGLKREVIETGLGLRKEFFPYIQGVRHCFEVLMEPLRDDAGRIIGITGAAVDITARMQAEAVTKDSEVRYRRLFESAKDGILILDAHAATITHANPFLTDLLGYSPEEMQGKELWQIGLFQDVQASMGAMQELQQKGYIRYEDLPLETKAGLRINVEFISNLYGDGGEAVIQCNIRDISDRKRLEESLRQHAADLSEADRRKDEFLATLAHELRNPLAPIRNGLHIMKLAEVDAATVETARAMMERQVEQMTRLIDDLMDVSRISQGKIQLQKTRLSLADAVRNAIETSHPLIDVQGHELVVDLPPHPIYVDGDLTRLSQVFANLLNNAAKYTDRGGRIRLTVERQGSDAVVSVTDNGVGIRADMLAHVFDMFAQIDGSFEKSQGGLGIGLNIVKRLVTMHGGSITAESGGPGMGSTLTVRLPVLIEKPKEQGLSDLSSESIKLTACRILIVDDNRDAAVSLAMLLKIGGHDTQVAHDGVEAVAKTADFKPDIVLLDIGLPKMNGYDTCRAIREQPWRKDIVIVALTGWGQDEDRRKSSAAGFNGHLVKPVDHAALMKLLSGLYVV